MRSSSLGPDAFLALRFERKRSLAKSRTPFVDSREADTMVPLGETKCARRDSGNYSSKQVFDAGGRSLPTYAMRDKDFVAALQKGEVYGCGGREDAEARMESWKYDPAILARSGIADPLSLYLSLRHSADERVQKEIQKLTSLAIP